MRAKGFIKLSRKFFTNKMWEAARTYSECEAWLDLIQSARFEATQLTACIGGRDIVYTRGQYPASIRFLSDRWQWGERKTRSFLNKLTKEKMITTSCSQGMNIITLCKYDDYNSEDEPKDTAKDTAKDTDIALIFSKLQALETQQKTQQKTQGGHSEDTKKKNDKKEKNNTKKESTNVDEKEVASTDALSLTPENEKFIKFNMWLKDNAPYIADDRNMTHQITDVEFKRLYVKYNYTGEQIREILLRIENRKDLRKKYTNLYVTLLNWLKKEYGKTEYGKTE